MMRTIAVGGLLATPLLLFNGSFAPIAGAQVLSDDGTYVWGQIDDDADEVVVGGVSTSDDVIQSSSHRDGIVTVEGLAPACDGNRPDSGVAAYQMCLAAVSSCPPTAGGDQQVLMWRWTQQIDEATGVPLTEWAIAAPICLSWDQIETPNLPLLVLREFQDRTKLLAATVRIQPPAGRTLINLDTIFYTDDPSTTIYGIPIARASVDLQITAAGFSWHFGDGADATSDTAGRPYPEQEITHRYTSTDTLTARVDVTYAGRYRVDAGTWLDIPGTATVTGTGVDLTIVAAHSELVAGIAIG